jgi:hypothetical protein
MNRKAIQKILKGKHESFISSITDEKVKNLVKDNSIITGGSIVSLLLNEKVNDFDYYFTDKETVEAVANYYVDLFNSNHPEIKIAPEVVVEESRVRINIQSSGVTSENGDLGYEYFENLPQEYGQEWVEKVVGEADEFDQNNLEKIIDINKVSSSVTVNSNTTKYRPIFLTGNAITLSDKIQLVIRFYGSPEEIHKNYDFIHCCNYWVSKNNELVLNPKALESILAKHLFYQGSLYPISSVIRTRKFLKQGWHINAGQYLKMCFQISNLDLTDLDVLEDQLTGVDQAYFIEVINYCKKRKEEDENFELTQPYICTIIDKIF